MGAVAGMGPYVELEEQSASSVARRAQINSLEQVISLGERSTCDVEPILPVMPWPTGSLVRATTGIGRFLRGGEMRSMQSRSATTSPANARYDALNSDRAFDQPAQIRCASMAVQAISASTSVLKGEPPTFMAHRLWWIGRQDAK